MNWLDWTVVVAYSLGLLGLGFYFGKNKDKQDYYLGGRSMGWFPLTLSTMATQLSAISFISAPAFVALKANGGMQWLSYEFGLPIAMIFLMAILIPPLYRSGVVSAYELLERRFGSSSRIFISILFQLSRSFGTAVMVYTLALILESVLNIAFWQTILIVGVITLVYSFQGGMKAVVWGDTIQMIILVVGLLICIGYALHELGGMGNFQANIDHSRLKVTDFQSWGFQGDEFGFWPMIIGGIFFHFAYYGTDQTQIQRALSAKNMGVVRTTLTANGLIRFPITFIYCFMGLAMASLLAVDQGFMDSIPSDKPDKMVPVFILRYLPHGAVGLLIVAMLAAAMSTLSSAINSLSAATVEDLIVRGRDLSPEKTMNYCKALSLFWGVVCLLLSFAVGGIADTVIEAVSKVNSLFYGPILAMFLLAVLFKTVGTKAANLGLAAGVLTNFILWQFVPNVFWMWWNAIGAVITLGVGLSAALLFSSASGAGTSEAGAKTTGMGYTITWPKQQAIVLAGFFTLIVLFSVFLPKLF